MMPEQYPYPERGWSTGRMRKIGEAVSGEDNIGEAAGLMADHPVVSSMERMQRARKEAQTPKYETELTHAEEIAFQEWKKKNVRPEDTGQDYDFRGAFRAGVKADEAGHWPDTYKKPNHPTFSTDSIYARDRPDLAGRWEGETYIPPGGG